MSKLCAEQLCHVITFRVPGGHIGEDGVGEVAARPVLGNRSVLGENLVGGDVALDDAAVVHGEGGRPRRLGVGRGSGEAAGEVKRGEDEEEQGRREESEAEAGARGGR